jgi:hypothetical protein
VVSLESQVDDKTIGVCHRATTDVTFSFVADDPSLLMKPITTTERLWVGSSAGVPTSCVDKPGLKVGATFTVTRHEQIVGTCSPVVYELPKTSTARVCACTPCDETGTGGCF